MTRTSAVAAALFVALLATPAHANVTGNQLLTACTKPDAHPDRQVCMSYVRGAADMMIILHSLTPDAIPVCMTAEETGVQMADMLVKYLRAHPEDRHLNGGTIIAIMLRDVWPCQTTKRESFK